MLRSVLEGHLGGQGPAPLFRPCPKRKSEFEKTGEPFQHPPYGEELLTGIDQPQYPGDEPPNDNDANDQRRQTEQQEKEQGVVQATVCKLYTV